MLLARMKRPRRGRLPRAGGLRLRLGVLPGLGLLAALALAAPAAQAADDCPNAEFRTGAAQYLPDCRAYEMVSPVQKNNGGVGNATNVTGIKAGADGENVMFGAVGAFAGAQSLPITGSYFSGRSADGWATSAIGWRPWVIRNFANNAQTPFPMGISMDGAKTAIVIDRDPVTNLQIPASAFLLDMRTGDITRMTPDPLASPGAWGNSTTGVAGDPTFENVFIGSNWSFNSEATQVPGNTSRLYHFDATSGALELASWSSEVEGQPVGGRLVSNAVGRATNFISANGQVYYFTSTDAGLNHPLYRGQVGVKKSVNVMTAEIPGQNPPATGTGTYQGADIHGDRVFFMTTTALVPEDTNTTNDLYMYDHAKSAGDRLTLISEDKNGNANGGVAVRSLGNSDDGRVVYFTTQNQILPGEDATAGDKLYRWHDGETASEVKFLGRVTASGNIGSEASVSSDGRFAAFASSFSIAGAQTGGLTQAYVYDDATGTFACASCRQDGSPNGAAVALGAGQVNTISIDDKPIRYLIKDGRVTFTTADRLVARDTNGVSDVYSYKDGDLQLISSGRDSSPSRLGDVSADGSAIFFTTRERLVSDDVDDLLDLYVARVGGGIASTGGQADAECEGADCQGAAPVSPAATPTASSQAGHGNVRESQPLRIAVRAQRAVNRGATRLQVRVPRAGRVVISGPGVRRSARRAGRAGVQAVPLRLNRRALRQLRNRGVYRTRARVVFRARGGESATARVPVTFRYRAAAR